MKSLIKLSSLILILFCFLQSVAVQKPISGIKINADIELIQIKDSIFIHTTWIEIPDYGRFPSNGVFFIKNGKALTIDTPNTNEQTEILYNYIKDSLGVKIEKVIVGHYHSDCLGGLGFLHQIGVESISGSITHQICVEQNLPIPQTTFTDSLIIDFEGETIICRYPGGGHTIDNIVVYFPSTKVLFGGCLVKSIDSKGLGNTADAVVADWDYTIERVISEFHDVELVVPGHGNYGDKSLLNHTIQLVKEFKARN